MTQRSLTNQLSELGAVRRAPAVWREATRARLLSLASAQAPRRLSLGDRADLIVQRVRLAFSPFPLVPVATAVLVLALGYTPLAQATGRSLPGDFLYPVKRAAESVELSLRASSSTQGLYYLTLASRRLSEATALPASASEARAKLLRDYNISVGFAQASLQSNQQSVPLAATYDRAASDLANRLAVLQPTLANRQVYATAVSITDKLAGQALALFVGAHKSDTTNQDVNDLTARLEEQIAKVEATLGGVNERLHDFPAVRPAPRVVLESREAVVPAAEASLAAKQSLTEAKELVAKKQFSLALQKMQEGEAITLKTAQAVDKVAEAKLEELKPGETTEKAVEPKVKGDETQAPETTGNNSVNDSTQVQKPSAVPVNNSVQVK